MMPATARRILVRGVVQGVGFRPFVHTLAEGLGLAGWVRNTAAGVEIEIEGVGEAVETFITDLGRKAPPLARIDDVRVNALEPHGYGAFEIHTSADGDGVQPIPPDVATCPACLAEMRDPRDRRCGYPFTNCTDCGPRFTIIRATPYDRPNTTMASFPMCPACRTEYDDPTDRRFHAQPNACPACGPRLRLIDPAGRPLAGDPLAEARRRLAAGEIVGIKGIGGFHLACDATSDAAVRRLRQRKGREAKPLALMVADLKAAERLCGISDDERALLVAPARPIVILHERPGSGIAASVAPGLGQLGLMLPYSPLHHLLFAGEAGEGGPLAPLVMTSGNRSDEPIATDDVDALQRLGTIADVFLVHDRPIHIRCDDSVTRIADGRELPVRRSRGQAPFPVRLPFETRPILACGAELKTTVCLTLGPYAFVSPHIGDLENYETYASYSAMIEHLAALFRVRPEAVAHDLHPGYLSTRFARGLDPGLPRVAVQHHHAHVAACMAEHRLTGPVIGVAFDGTGYGLDGRIWGGEFLVADYAGFTRAGHLGYVPMPGGDRAVREPFRMALAHLACAGQGWDRSLAPAATATDQERRLIARQLERGLNAPLTSSVGRLFDAVAALVGLQQRARYEAQAAIRLEALAAPAADAPGEAYPVVIADGAPAVIDPRPVILGVVADLAARRPPPLIAARFHATVAAMIAEMCARIRASTGLDRVVLSGGVFQNVIVLTGARRALAAAGFDVYSHHLMPPNDGGIALGQAVVAHARLQRDGHG
jgi:hydrogenase maturation protein HypF